MALKRKWKKALLWSLGIVIALGMLGAFAVNYAVNYFLDAMISSAIEEGLLNLDETDLTEGLENAPVPDEPVEREVQQPDSDHTNVNESSSASDSPNPQETAVETSESVSDSPKMAFREPDHKPNNHTKPKSEKKEFAYSAEIAVDKIQAVQKNITVKEKAKVTSVMLKNFDTGDLNYLMNLAKGGLTLEEKKEAKKLFMDRLSEDEYNELIAIAAKYGLSRGEKYAETERPE